MKKIVFFSQLFVVTLCLIMTPLTVSAGTWTSGNTTVTTSGTTITVSPKSGTNGVMADYSYSGDREWVSGSTAIIIEEGVTYIGAYAFIEATSVTDITIPVSVTSIGENAFASCTKMAKIHYAGSPNQWASIAFSNDASNPFGDVSGNNGKMYFFGCDNTTTTLTFEPGLERINDYAFYKMQIANLNIPNSVNYIGRLAFKCAISGQVCINRTTPPTTGYEAFSYTTAAKLYVPGGSQSTYQSAGTPWYRSGYGKTDGASGVNEVALSGTLSSTYGSGVTWELDADGVLTFDASASGASKSITLGGGSNYPWGLFRRLVHKIKLRGEIEALNNSLAYHWFLTELILDQNTVPTCSSHNIALNSIGSGAAYDRLYNSCHNLKLSMRQSTILDGTSSRLGADPWVDGHWDKTVDGVVLVDESVNNTELLTAINNKLTAPFTMQLRRATLSSSYYNTFCSPVPMSAAEVTSVFGAGVDIRELESTSLNGEVFTLNFSDPLSAIEAGHPYLIKPAENVSNPTIASVEPDNVVSKADNDFDVPGGHITAHGILSPYTPEADEYGENFLFLMANNKLTWAESGTLKGMRAFFKVVAGAPSYLPKARAVMRFPNVATGVDEIIEWRDESGEWRDESRKVIRDGQLLIERNGKTYNAQGQLVN